MSDLTFVAFEPRNDGFIASVPMEQLDSLGEHPDLLLQEASEIYKHAVGKMQLILSEIGRIKGKRNPIPAQKVWELGDAVIDLVDGLAAMSLQLDRLYEHLVRDLGMNQKRLGTVITFRRHLSDKGLIPESLGWSQCEKNARKVAESLSKGDRDSSLV